ncbi:MAG TPA: site-specific integrase [Solirubrobacterales bacterium]|nr:site-specific integrase [Solirubrobacterales bacterium]
MATGIRKRGSSYEASVYLKREERKLRRTFPTLAAAKAWRAEAQTAAHRGALRAPSPTTVREAWAEWYAGALAGIVRNASADSYKPSALRAYETAMRLRVVDEIGGIRLVDVRRPDLQHLADELLAAGASASVIAKTFLPLRAIFTRAVDAEIVAVNPCDGIKLPAVRSTRDRALGVAEAEALLVAVPNRDRALWATAMFAGLRLGELQALRVNAIDLASGVIRVEKGWDAKQGEIEPKSAAARRRVPIAAVLRDYLAEHLIESGRRDGEFAFGRTPNLPFGHSAVQRRADRSWRDAGLARVTPYECRHTFASLMIAAGVNAKALSTFMGHSTIAITLDLYGHLMPGSEAEAAGLLDGYVAAQRESAAEAARSAGTGAFSGAPLAHGA